MEKKVYYGICATAADNSVKVIKLQGGQNNLPPINEGDLLTVHFLNKSSTAEITFTLTVNDHNNGITSNNSGLPVKIRAAEPSSGNDNEWDFINAWEEGEVKQFVAVSHYSEGDGNSTQINGWEMLDGGNATTELYGDTKLFQPANAQEWLAGAQLDDEDNTAITPATIRELFLNRTPNITLTWTQSEPTGTLGEDYIKLGDLSISTDTTHPKAFYVTKDDIEDLIDVQPWLDRTSQLKNNGHSDDIPSEGENLPEQTSGYGWRGKNRWFIENYEESPVEFVNNFIGSGDVTLGTKGDPTDSETLSHSVTINGPTTIDNILHGTGAVTLDDTLTVDGAITGHSTISATSDISSGRNVYSASDIYEGGNTNSYKLKNRYSGTLYVKRYRTPVVTLTAKGTDHDHIHDWGINIGITNCMPLGVINWNINRESTDTAIHTHRVYPWELHIGKNGTADALYVGLANTSNESEKVFLVFDILYVRNTNTDNVIVDPTTEVRRTWNVSKW